MALTWDLSWICEVLSCCCSWAVSKAPWRWNRLPYVCSEGLSPRLEGGTPSWSVLPTEAAMENNWEWTGFPHKSLVQAILPGALAFLSDSEESVLSNDPSKSEHIFLDLCYIHIVMYLGSHWIFITIFNNMRKFYYLNREKGLQECNNNKKVVRDPEGWVAGERGPLPEAWTSQRSHPGTMFSS